ncbi:MAG: pyridoxal-phosphate dependent enzyme [Candidatus Aminicenantes bacterium]|nr:pyridoxal-phosphate dependent enzyme [Candidatus Aminicenantes bacterium]
MWKYHRYLPVRDTRHILTLGEGATPLVHLDGGPFLKMEQLNPSGSYKDRFASSAVSWMREQGLSSCLATSSGNTGSALAAYCARAGIPCHIFLVETTPAGKAVQMLAYGAVLKRVRGFGLDPAASRDVMERLQREAPARSAALQISAFTFSPEGMDGVKTIGYEIADDLDDVDDVFVPIGGGGLLTAIARGFDDYFREGRIPRVPRIHAVQPRGCATVTGPLDRGETQAVEVECTSVISGLQVPNVIDAQLALDIVLETGGSGQSVSDREVFRAQEALFSRGVYCEPAGATAYAGYLKARSEGSVSASNRAVCIVTGHGFKDLGSVERAVSSRSIPMVELDALLD